MAALFPSMRQTATSVVMAVLPHGGQAVARRNARTATEQAAELARDRWDAAHLLDARHDQHSTG